MKSKVNKVLIGVIVLLVGTMGYLSYRYVVVLNEKPKCDDIVVDDKPSRDLTEYEVEPLYNILATFGDNRRPNQFFKNSKVLFKDLDDGTYRIYETKAPNRYEGLDTYFEIEIVDNIIYYENEITNSFTVVNTNDGTEAMVLGDVIDDEDYQVWVEASEKANKAETSDNLRVMEFGLLACLSIVLIYVFLKKKMSE